MDSFVIRQLPKAILDHYKDKGTHESINYVVFFNADDSKPIILVGHGPGHLPAEAMDEWSCNHTFHGAIKNLPKQIFRIYRQQKDLSKITCSDFYMTGETQTITVDLGNRSQTWQWLPAEGEEFNSWQRVTDILNEMNNPAGEFARPKWTLNGGHGK